MSVPLRPEIYRQAAQFLDARNAPSPGENVFDDNNWNGGYRCGCCAAIRNIQGSGKLDRTAFAKWFAPRARQTCRTYFWADPWSEAGRHDKQARVLALLFMEQIAKDSANE